jgi:uncharacterized protein with predicted RNA binding PUA domain
MTGTAANATIEELRTVADYQFGAGAGAALFPPETADELTLHRSTGGRPRQVGRFTLGLEGGRRLLAAFDPPAARVVVGSESEPFVRDGKNAFAKFVRTVDPAVRPGDEVAIVRADDTLLAVGRAELSADGMGDFESGAAVSVREGNGADE